MAKKKSITGIVRFDKIAAKLPAMIKQITESPIDMTTGKGREANAKCIALCRAEWVALGILKKEEKDESTVYLNTVQSAWRDLDGELHAACDENTKALEEYKAKVAAAKAKEAKRKNDIKELIADIRRSPEGLINASAEELQERYLETLKTYQQNADDKKFMESHVEAATTWDAAEQQFKTAIEVRTKFEADQKKLKEDQAKVDAVEPSKTATSMPVVNSAPGSAPKGDDFELTAPPADEPDGTIGEKLADIRNDAKMAESLAVAHIEDTEVACRVVELLMGMVENAEEIAGMKETK